MSRFQRIKEIIFGVVIILYAILMLLVPEEAYDTVAALITLSLFFYGARLLWFYFTMARHMVGGKSTMYQAIFVLDLGLFTAGMASMPSYVIMLYLLGIYCFTGVVDILSAFEKKKQGAASWKVKLISGIVTVLFAVVLVVLGLILHDAELVVYGYCISLIYTGVMKIVSAVRRTAIVYIR